MNLAKVKNFCTMLVKAGTIIPSALTIFVALIFALNYLFLYLRGDIIAEASGRTDSTFRVFYLENDIYPNNPIPQNLQYMMSFTDFIEVDSRFSAQFSDNAEIHYTYTAVERLVIRHMATLDGNLNAIVFEESYPLAEMRGILSGNEVSFTKYDNNMPGGTYTIFPKKHIETYLYFITKQAEQMKKENIITQNLRGFSAELFIDFTYNISVTDWGINESITHGYRLPLSAEIYFFVPTGNQAFNRSFIIATQVPQITLPIAMVFVALMALSAYGLFRGIKKLQSDPNEHRQEVLTILKKYANEIAISSNDLPLSKYTFMQANEFETLLMLAINLNKHIMCHQNNAYTEFAVIVDEYAYYYRIDYNEDNNEVEEISAPILKYDEVKDE